MVSRILSQLQVVTTAKPAQRSQLRLELQHSRDNLNMGSPKPMTVRGTASFGTVRMAAATDSWRA